MKALGGDLHQRIFEATRTTVREPRHCRPGEGYTDDDEGQRSGAQEAWNGLHKHDALLKCLPATSLWTQAGGRGASGARQARLPGMQQPARLAPPMTWLESELWWMTIGESCGHAINPRMACVVT